MLKEVEDLLAGLKLTPEERTQAEALLASEDRQKEIKRGYHAASEADRLMTQARQAEQAAQAKAAEADTKINEWLKWYEEEEPKVTQYMTQAQAAEAKVNALRGYLVSQGIDPDSLTGAVTPPEPKAPQAFSWEQLTSDPKFKETFIDRNEAQQSLNAVLQLGDLQHKLNVEHRKLFGTDMEDFATLRQEAFAAKKPLDAFVEEKLFAAKRTELAEQQLQARTDQIVKEKLAAIISQQGIPQPTGDIVQDGPKIFSDEFTGKTRVGDDESRRLAVERALAFDAQNPNHAADMGGSV